MIKRCLEVSHPFQLSCQNNVLLSAAVAREEGNAAPASGGWGGREVSEPRAEEQGLGVSQQGARGIEKESGASPEMNT